MRKLATALILGTVTLLLIFAVTGDKLRAGRGASADALAGLHERASRAEGPLEGHKSLHDFSAASARPVSRRPAALAGLEELGAGIERGHVWLPSRGATRSAPEIARRPWAGTLTAKVWADTDAFVQWSDLVARGQGAPSVGAQVARAWSLPTTDRILVQVRDQAGKAVVDMKVALMQEQRTLARGRTDNHGRVAFFPSFVRGRDAVASETRFTVRVLARERTFSREIKSGETVQFALPRRAPSPAAVGDVMLVMDTTGSMSDELRYFQSELENVIARADEQLARSVEMRVSVNFYRDEGDAYVVRAYPFTKQMDEATSVLLMQTSGGGGDYPEAVDRALASAIDDHAWRASARGRLLFLVLDAPPHSGSASLRSIRRSLAEAARKGIRIFPVAGSGVDKETEFLLRHFAVLTGGAYVYLTDDSGVGGHHVEATGGRAQTERLNDALTRLIVESLREEGAPRPVYQARR